MNADQEVTFSFRTPSRNRDQAQIRLQDTCVPRIARLMALAIRFEGLVRDQTVQNYTELAQLGRVTRARMSQIIKLLQLAPDLQEQLVFLPEIKGLSERNLREIVRQLDWSEQRRMFQRFMAR